MLRSVDRSPRPARVVIAGGGVAGLEALLALRILAPADTQLTLLAPEPEFTYRPLSVGEPFGGEEAQRFSLADVAADQSATLVEDALAAVDTAAATVATAEGRELPYDHLLVAVGARPTVAVPGAVTFAGGRDAPALRAVLDGIEDGTLRQVAFALPPGVSWPLPLYELALMTAAHASACRADVELTLVTHEQRPLAMFGTTVGERIARLLADRGVAFRAPARALGFADGILELASGGHVRADRVVALPRLEGPWLPGLAHDAWGFIPTDAHGRVSGEANVHAAGDVTTFPLKQGGLAAQQADAAASAIAAAAGARVEPHPFRPVLRGLLLTGGVPLYLRAEATAGAEPPTVAADAASVPLPEAPAGDRTSMVGTGALWWPPSKIAGRYLAPYLTTARPVPLASAPLRDRGAPAAPAAPRDDPGVALALALADADAQWGDFRFALRTLNAAAALAGGELPPAYAAKRAEWERAAEREG